MEFEEAALPDWRDAAHEFGSVVVLSTADYDAPLWTNKQHIATRLAGELPVLYVESLGLRRPRLTSADMRRIAKRLFGIVRRPKPNAQTSRATVPNNLEVAAPIVIPFHSTPLVRRINRWLLARQIDSRITALPPPRMLWTFTPLAIDLVDLAAFDHKIYHCVDDLGSVPGVSQALVEDLERRLAPAMDDVVVTTRSLRVKLERLNPRTREFHNVVDVDHFMQAREDRPVPDDLAAIHEPRALYIGALSDHKIDWDLIAVIAKALPEWSFVFIGPQGEEEAQSMARKALNMENVHAIGLRPYANLPEYLRGAKVGLIPYRLTSHTAAIFPMKTLEYVAAGLPVVATALPALLNAPNFGVQIATSSDQFADDVREALHSTPESNQVAVLYAMRNTWDTLIARIFALVHEGRDHGS